MKLCHATAATIKDAALDIAEQIERDGFEAQFDYNYQAAVVFLASKPLKGWGGWQDAWIVVDIPDNIAEQYRYTFDDDLYNCKCYAFPEDIINKYPREATIDPITD